MSLLKVRGHELSTYPRLHSTTLLVRSVCTNTGTECFIIDSVNNDDGKFQYLSEADEAESSWVLEFPIVIVHLIISLSITKKELGFIIIIITLIFFTVSWCPKTARSTRIAKMARNMDPIEVKLFQCHAIAQQQSCMKGAVLWPAKARLWLGSLT